MKDYNQRNGEEEKKEMEDQLEALPEGESKEKLRIQII